MTDSVMTKEPLMKASANKIKLQVSKDVLLYLADDGLAVTTVVRSPLR